MTEATQEVLIITIGIAVTIIAALLILRSRFRSGNVKLGQISGKMEAHEGPKLSVKDVEQSSEGGDNQASIKTKSAVIGNIRQKTKKNNTIDIGN